MVNSRDLLAMMDDLIQLTIIDEESPQSFKVRAYEKAKIALETYPGDITSLSLSELSKLNNVGRATASKVREMIQTGTVASLDELRLKYPPDFVELSRIPGVGPKTLKLMRRELGIENLDTLKSAIDAQQLRTLPRMGAASEAKIAKAIDRLGLVGKHHRTPVGEALTAAHNLVEQLEAIDSVSKVEICGSIRRMAETVSDVDITVASSDPGEVISAVVNHPNTAEVIGAGTTKASIVTHRNLQIDVRVVDSHQFGAATLYFTGSKAHNVALRQRAIDSGLHLNEYGLIDAKTSQVIASETEHSIYSALGLDFIEAPLREATGEIEAASGGSLPQLVQLSDIRGDLHYHSDRSGDGRSTLADMISHAASRNYEYLAITEHGENLGGTGVSQADMADHRVMIDTIQSQYPDMTLLFGCELNIGPDGELDYDAEFRSELDYAVASVHSHFDLPAQDQTARLIRAISDPSVRSIGHLTGRYIGRRPGIDLDIDAVLTAMLEADVALEVNSSLSRLDASSDVVRLAVGRGVKLVINSDSHHISHLDRMIHGVRTAQRGWAPRDQVINTWPRSRFLEWLNP